LTATAAQPYTRTFTSPPAGVASINAAPTGGIDLGDDILRVPIRRLDRNGRVVTVHSP
jgi:hypothetical protein